jgi:glucose-6-phosphate 1-epimerase
MDITILNENFGLPGVLLFEQHGELARAVITTPAASATVYLQGAHVAEWQPAGQQPVLFMSAASAFKKGKAIRGGIPVIFPWFGDRHDGQPGPAHGFARTEEWEFGFAALAGDELHLSFLLTPNETSRALGFDHFRVSYHLTIGRTLNLKLSVVSDAQTPLVYEEAFHTYFAVGDVRETSVTGLHNVEYLDKRDGGAQKTQADDPLILTRDTDRVYLDTESTCVIDDKANARKITVAKSNSSTTIVWNPWTELTAKMADMEPEGWKGMICIESANAADASITLAHGEIHHMGCVISVEKTTA